MTRFAIKLIIHPFCVIALTSCDAFMVYLVVINHWWQCLGPVFCRLLGVSSGCARSIEGRLLQWPDLWLAGHSVSLLRARDRKRALDSMFAIIVVLRSRKMMDTLSYKVPQTFSGIQFGKHKLTYIATWFHVYNQWYNIGTVAFSK